MGKILGKMVNVSCCSIKEDPNNLVLQDDRVMTEGVSELINRYNQDIKDSSVNTLPIIQTQESYQQNFDLTINAELKILNDKISIEIKDKGVLSVDSALNVLYIFQRISENSVKRRYPDIDKRRRDAYWNDDEYEKICKDFLTYTAETYVEATDYITLKLYSSGVTMESVQEVLGVFSPSELEKSIRKFNKPDCDEYVLNMEKSIIKEAFLYMGNKFIQDMSDFLKNISKIKPDDVMFKLMLIKSRVEDDLYLKYKLSEKQLQYLLYINNLYDDIDVQYIHDKMTNVNK